MRSKVIGFIGLIAGGFIGIFIGGFILGFIAVGELGLYGEPAMWENIVLLLCISAGAIAGCCIGHRTGKKLDVKAKEKEY